MGGYLKLYAHPNKLEKHKGVKNTFVYCCQFVRSHTIINGAAKLFLILILSLFIPPQIVYSDLSVLKVKDLTEFAETEPWYVRISGSRVAYVDYADDNLYLYDIETEALHQLNFDGASMELDVAGDYIAYTADRDANGPDLYLYDIENDSEIQIRNTEEMILRPAIDGDYVAWEEYDGTENQPWIKLYQISTGITSIISTPEWNNEQVYVYGDYVVWAQRKEPANDLDIIMYQISTGETTAVTNDIYNDWSPTTNGSVVAWQSYDGGWSVHMYDIATGVSQEIPDSDAYEPFPRVYNELVAWDCGSDGICIYDLSNGLGKAIEDTDNYYFDDLDDSHLTYRVADGGGWGIMDIQRLQRPEYEISEIDYSWDGVQSPTDQSAADEGSLLVMLPWSFPFYEESYSTARMDANGFVYFSAEDIGGTYDLNLSDFTVPVIAAWTEDLDSTDQTNHPLSYGYQLKDDRVVFTWYTESYSEGGSGQSNLFEVVLFQNGQIKVDYADFDSGCELSSGIEGISPGDFQGGLLEFGGYDDNGNILPDICTVGLSERSFLYSTEVAVPEDPPEDPEDPQEPPVEPPYNPPYQPPQEPEYFPGTGKILTPPMVVSSNEPNNTDMDVPTSDQDTGEQTDNRSNLGLEAVRQPKHLVAGIVPELLVDFIKSLPPEMNWVFPYLLFILLAILARLFFKQAILEYLFEKKMIVILKREKLIAEEKDNFLMLASHYLRTPITIMFAGGEMLKDAGQLNSKEDIAVLGALNELKERTEGILKEIEENTYLKEITTPDVRKESLKRLASTYIWLPLVLIFVIIAIGHYLFVNIHQLTVPFITYAVEALIFIIVAAYYIYALRRLYNEKQKTQKVSQEMEKEIILDDARNEFILSVDRDLRNSLDKVKQVFSVIKSNQKDSIAEATRRLEEILGKIHIIISLKSGRVERRLRKTPLLSLVQSSLKLSQKEISAKSLDIVNHIGNTVVETDPDKLKTVVSAVINNAVKFNRQSGSINITAKNEGNATILTIKDSGIGVTPEKQNLIFHPLGRATSALDFNYEGIGLSLYLAKVIMIYLDSQIDLKSDSTGTTVNIIISNPV